MYAFVPTPARSLGPANFGLGIQIQQQEFALPSVPWLDLAFLYYPDHQSFVLEEPARNITSDPPSHGPYIPLELTNRNVVEADPSRISGVPISATTALGILWASFRHARYIGHPKLAMSPKSPIEMSVLAMQ
ncbi:hypothetical protein ARMGADRAFT_1022625 [Armillaria gallica]|uniref:Uncharacterized protein n=1 Tax=Armillaria gallica TaxID=47427 RepID=A0A2H3E9R2_ARMGA|nr:hypothetical protein ARMGADRAFT_1022625 [Armillaria gallica]